ncbi:MAG: Crp/Fnr family transcriptional regulator [Flavobacteriales bacterium]|nr:Crp/Fnr family transcriptional regulator [Flavobacteriales bacterium]
MSLELNEISKFFETEYPLNQEGLKELLSLFRPKKFAKGSRLLEAGSTEKELRFMNSGVIREYYASPDKEVNINFYTKPHFVSDLSSFIHDTPTRKHQEALSDIQILTIAKDDFRQLLEKYQCGKSFIDLSFRNLLKQKELLEYNRVTKSADELYKELLIYKPSWLEKVPQYHIASYLEVTPETLSRIRKRIS